MRLGTKQMLSEAMKQWLLGHGLCLCARLLIRGRLLIAVFSRTSAKCAV